MTNSHHTLSPRATAALLWRKTKTGLYSSRRLLGMSAGGPPVAYVVEQADWAIHWVGHYFSKEINKLRPGLIATTTQPERLNGEVAHYGSQFLWGLWQKAQSPRNKTVVNYFHGSPEDGPEMAAHVDQFLRGIDGIDKVVVSARLVGDRLASWGVPAEKIVHVPLAIDTELFRPPAEGEKAKIRAELGIPADAIVIGSFQKDGVGWGDGMEPKLIKGPDLFVEALARLKKDFPVFALLSGPARGYVKAGLEAAGVPFAHHYLKSYPDIARLYRALDLYLVSSREEGGPMALLESMATGVDLVSTRVGMAPDLVDASGFGTSVQPEDRDALYQRCALQLAESEEARMARRERGFAVADDTTWAKCAVPLLEQVYEPLLDR